MRTSARRTGTTVLANEREQLAQAMAMMNRRIQGASIRTLQAEFNSSRATVARRLRLARGLGLIEDLQTTLLHRLAPLAAATFEAALMQGDLGAAKAILVGLGILQGNVRVANKASADCDPRQDG